MDEGLGLTRRAALGSIAVGSGLLLAETGAFASVVADRSTGLDATDDGSALLSITGKTAAETPTFTNRLTSAQSVELSATEPSAEFDVVGESTTGNPVTFTLDSSGSAGESQEVEMTADVTEIDVDVTGTFDNGTIELTRTFEIPQASQVDVTANVRATGNSGKFEFGLANAGSIDAELVGIRVDGTTANAERVRSGEVLHLVDAGGTAETPRRLVWSPLGIGPGEPITGFTDGSGTPDSVLLPATSNSGPGPELGFEFDRFQYQQSTNNWKNSKMKGETVEMTLEFSDGSTASYTLADT